MARLEIDGYGQIELNQVAFPRDGRIVAQCKLSETDFAEKPAENGMILAVDEANRQLLLPVAAVSHLPLALVYSAEKIYEPTKGLKHFANFVDGFLPRLGYLAVGDRFTINAIELGSVTAEELAAFKDSPVFGVVGTDGIIKLTTTATDSGLLLQVTRDWGMPDGQKGYQFLVIRA